MFAGTSFKTVAPAPILTLSLTSISPIIIAFAPISTLFPIFGDPPPHFVDRLLHFVVLCTLLRLESYSGLLYQMDDQMTYF